MPVYDYDCAACGLRVELVHGVHSPGPAQCPSCGGGPLRKAIAAAAVHFKGSGWAKRDRRATVSSSASKGSNEAVASNDGAARDGGEAPGGSRSEGGAGGGTDRAAEPATPAPKTAGTGTATKAD
jgi:putative FmdB family regulatory protein